MLVAVFIQVVVQAHALLGHQGIGVQQRGGGLQRGHFTAAKDVIEHKTQQAVVGPLAALHQQHLAGGQQQHPARGMGTAEDAPGDDALPSLLYQRFRRRRFALELVLVRAKRERILIVAQRIVGAKNQKLRRALLNATDT